MIVLASAFMHALWNALVKVDGDRLMAMAVITGLTAAFSPVLIVLSPPIAAESWKYLVLSAALNNLYFFLLIESYRVGDLSHAYPLARGSAPLLVALGSAIFAGERLGPGGIAGVLLVSAGIMSLVAGSRFDPRIRRRAIGYPLATGATIAAYTVVDGIGVRASGSPVGYIGWLFALFAIPIVLVAIVSRRTEAIVFLRARWRPGGLAALFNFGSYGLAIFALSLGAMAHVSALRETSVIIAALDTGGDGVEQALELGLGRCGDAVETGRVVIERVGAVDEEHVQMGVEVQRRAETRA